MEEVRPQSQEVSLGSTLVLGECPSAAQLLWEGSTQQWAGPIGAPPVPLRLALCSPCWGQVQDRGRLSSKGSSEL